MFRQYKNADKLEINSLYLSDKHKKLFEMKTLAFLFTLLATCMIACRNMPPDAAFTRTDGTATSLTDAARVATRLYDDIAMIRPFAMDRLC